MQQPQNLSTSLLAKFMYQFMASNGARLLCVECLFGSKHSKFLTLIAHYMLVTQKSFFALWLPILGVP